jgi:hypothetical protein
MVQLLTKLLQSVHSYYPIGMPAVFAEYPGYKKLEEIVEKKIDEVSNNIKTPWYFLIEDIKTKFVKYSLFDEGFHQFPSYYAKIEIERSKDGGKEFSRTVIINISLLTDYYTIYFEDFFKYSLYKDNKFGISRPPTMKIVYCKSCLEKYFLDFIDSLKSVIKQHFPKKEFIDHSILFDHEVDGGTVYGKMLEYVPGKNYSIYEYLFFSGINRSQMTVLE